MKKITPVVARNAQETSKGVRAITRGRNGKTTIQERCLMTDEHLEVG